jgi:hypothetical protein
VVRHIFQACPVWIYTQSNITSIIFTTLVLFYDESNFGLFIVIVGVNSHS